MYAAVSSQWHLQSDRERERDRVQYYVRQVLKVRCGSVAEYSMNSKVPSYRSFYCESQSGWLAQPALLPMPQVLPASSCGSFYCYCCCCCHCCCCWCCLAMSMSTPRAGQLGRFRCAASALAKMQNDSILLDFRFRLACGSICFCAQPPTATLFLAKI